MRGLDEVDHALRRLGRVRVEPVMGVRSDFRRRFWEVARSLVVRGRIEDVVHLASVAHHLVRFTRDALAGAGEASFYADPARSAFGGRASGA